MHDTLPLVTVILPCRNEEKFIAGCLDSIISSDYPKDRLEVLVVDGMSEDGTREILARYTVRHNFIMMLENKRKTTPCAFNTGIKNSRGDIIIIMGMHATYASDYITKCVKYLYEYGADNVGGVMVTVPRDNTLTGKAIAQALSHKFGVGNSMFRSGTKEPVFVDTVFGGCYRKEVFDKIGLFNEMLVKHQDMELNCRLRAAGGHILLAPDIVCQYYARTDIKSFLLHNFGNGLSIFSSLKESDVKPVSVRHLIPLIFVSSLITSTVLSILVPVFIWLLLAILCSYISAALYFSFKISRDRKDPKLILAMPPVFALLHVSHGLGSLYGVLCLLASKRFWSGHIFAVRNAPVRLK
ncbi:MAG: glycosyltransferase family 2 protein [Nitrospirota bacterium]